MRNIVISGSASGIGQACREKFEAIGDRVIGIDIRDADIIADLATREGRQQAIDQRLHAARQLLAGAFAAFRVGRDEGRVLRRRFLG